MVVYYWRHYDYQIAVVSKARRAHGRKAAVVHALAHKQFVDGRVIVLRFELLDDDVADRTKVEGRLVLVESRIVQAVELDRTTDRMPHRRLG